MRVTAGAYRPWMAVSGRAGAEEQDTVPSLRLSQYLTLAATLLLTTAGGYVGYQRFAPKPVAAARVVTADVSQGSITATVSATGSVASPAQSKLSFKSAGRLAQLLL